MYTCIHYYFGKAFILFSYMENEVGKNRIENVSVCTHVCFEVSSSSITPSTDTLTAAALSSVQSKAGLPISALDFLENDGNR